tara:strand:+ start:319 stop:567 length:249 start_codon:yes stop_codon:yes gene_type:complete
MPIKDDSVVKWTTVNGEKVPEIVVPAEVTITNTETGKQYGSDKEADDDVNNPATDTKIHHIRRDVKVSVAIHKIIKSIAGEL